MDMKQCGKCGVEKQLSEFSKDRGSKDGLYYICKECDSERVKEYIRTLDGYFTKVYGGQRKSSKKRGHEMPTYTKEELREWVMEFHRAKFFELWHNFILSDYKKNLAPSFDRIDDSKGYSLDNLQLMSWFVNDQKGHSDAKFKRIQSNNTSGVRGVSWDKSKNKWQVKIKHHGKNIHLGYFTDLEVAKTVRELAEQLILDNPSISIDKLKQSVKQ